MVVQSEDTK